MHLNMNHHLIIQIQTALILTLLGHQIKCQSNHEVPKFDTVEFWEQSNADELEEVKNIVTRNWQAKNVILFIGDGFGLSEFVASRIYQGQKHDSSKAGELHRMKMEERLPFVAMSKTFSTDHQVPDSASTASAMLTGVKTDSGVMGYSGESVERGVCGSGGNELKTIADHVKEKGKKVGVVTTARVTHATPAAVYAKTEQRSWEGSAPEGCTDIALQLLEKQDSELIDVILGGGMRSFMPQGKRSLFGEDESEREDAMDLVELWEVQGGKVVHQLNTLLEVEPWDLPLLGLFADSHLEYEGRTEKRASEPTLYNMTLKALELLKDGNKDGFFLMVESGRIDHGQHANNPYLTVTEADAFDQTISAVLDRVDLDETLVIVTADHSHAFAITGYPDLNNPILGYNPDWKTGQNQATLTYGAGPLKNVSAPPTNTNEYHSGFRYPVAINSTQGRHGAEDVLILANGPMAHLFQGIRMQTYIAAVMQYATCSGKYQNTCELKEFSNRVTTKATIPTSTSLFIFFCVFLHQTLLFK